MNYVIKGIRSRRTRKFRWWIGPHNEDWDESEAKDVIKGIRSKRMKK